MASIEMKTMEVNQDNEAEEDDLGTHSKKNNYENSEHGPICGRGGSCISLKKYIFL